jgi:hypothetical protein
MENGTIKVTICQENAWSRRYFNPELPVRVQTGGHDVSCPYEQGASQAVIGWAGRIAAGVLCKDAGGLVVVDAGVRGFFGLAWPESKGLAIQRCRFAEAVFFAGLGGRFGKLLKRLRYGRFRLCGNRTRYQERNRKQCE